MGEGLLGLVDGYELGLYGFDWFSLAVQLFCSWLLRWRSCFPLLTPYCQTLSD